MRRHTSHQYCFDMDRKVVFRLGSADVSQIRFGISPGHELAHAVRTVLDPGAHPLQWSWLRRTDVRVEDADFRLLAYLVRTQGYYPDLLTAPPTWDLSPAEEVERLREVPLEQVELDLGKVVLRSEGTGRALVQALAERPREARARIADAWESVWDQVMAQWWPQLHRLMRADVDLRVRRMATGGVEEMVGTLHELVRWRSDAVEVALSSFEEVLDCAGSGLVLTPSVMSVPRCSVITEKALQPTIFYPVDGLRESWAARDVDTMPALSGLLGSGRARILVALDGPRSTTEAARAAGLGAPTATHHLGALRAAGLVVSRRERRSVLHSRTPLGDALVGGAA